MVLSLMFASSTVTVAWIVRASTNSFRLFAKTSTNSTSRDSHTGPEKIFVSIFFLIHNQEREAVTHNEY